MIVKIYPETGAAYTIIFSNADNDAPKTEKELVKWIEEHAQQAESYKIIEE